MSPAIRVLVVDDSADLRLLVRRALEAAEGFEVVGEAKDGLEALRIAARTRPDLVLLDLAMPTMGGLKALPELRAAAPTAKIVVLSVYQGEHVRSAVTSRGAIGYLEKGIPARRFVSELTALAGIVEAVEGVVDEVTRTLDRSPANVAAARRFVAELLQRQGSEDLIDRVTLLVSELVTNAIVHAGSDVHVTVRLTADHVRVEVRDHDPEPLRRRDAIAALRENGRGLLLVRKLAGGWGVVPASDGKTVWFQIPRADLPRAAAVIG